MMRRERNRTYVPLSAALFLVPLLHPLLIPLVGVPSHLLWFVHVLPVALLTYAFGRGGGATAVAVSAVLVVAGERILGVGFFQPATWETAFSLGVSLTFTNVLMTGFALYARRVTARYQLLFDGSTTGIVRTDREGRVLAANPVARGLLRRGDGELEGSGLAVLLGIPGVEAVEDLERLGGWTGPVALGGAEAEGMAHLFVTALRSEPSAAPGWQILMVDRSTEVMQEREIERTGRLATLGEALAGVAHEVKNPLTTIRGFAEMGADESPPSSESRGMFETIGEQADRMMGLVQELLGYSRPRAEDDATAIHELVPRITRVQRIALGMGTNLVDRIEWEGVVPVNGGRIEQILQNLISNAVDAADGSLTITVSVLDRDDAVAVEVADDGPGVPQDLLDTVFRPFFTTKPEGVGTGLGLAISRRLARAAGGNLEVRNLKPRGAAFTLVLPKVAPDAAGPAQAADPRPAAAAEHTNG